MGTQSRRRRTALVHSATEVQVHTHSKSVWRDIIYECVGMRRDSITGCMPTVKVRGAILSMSAWVHGAIVSLGAYLQ